MVAAEYIVKPTRAQGPDHYDVSVHPSDSNGSRNYPWRACSLVLLLASQLVCAGEISGLPPHMAPTVRPDYSFYLGNDFAAAGTSDDFRTEQMIITGRLGDSWVAVVDHSIFTREDVP